MSTWTKWTPELIAGRLAAAHARWLEDEEQGKQARKPFTPAYLKATGDRQVYCQRRSMFRAALALVPEEVRDDWSARGHRLWNEKFCVARVKALFEEWRRDAKHGLPARKPWGVSYIDAADHPFLRSTQRHGVQIDDLVKRIGGELRLRWRHTRKLKRRPRVASRTFQSAAKELTAAHRRWRTDTEFGKPAKKPFGPQYLRNTNEERLDAWIRRNKAESMVLAYAPLAVGKAWSGQTHVRIVASTRLS